MAYNKKKSVMLLLLGIFFLTIPLLTGLGYSAETSEVGEEAWSAATEIPRVVNFVVVVVLLWFFLRKPLGRYFAKRREDIQKMLEETARERDEAEAKVREYKDKISNLEKEVADIRAESEREREALRQRLTEETQKATDRVIEQARVNIDLERKRAMDSLKTEAAKLALELAEGMLRENMDREDMERINSECIAGLRRE